MKNSLKFFPDSCMDNLTVDDYLLMEMIEERTLYIMDEISNVTASTIVSYIRQFNVMDQGIPIEERKPIKIFIASEGGGVFDGFTIINAIEQSETPVWTINNNFCFSMAFHILISGHKRFSYKNSIFLHHDGSDFMSGSALKNQDYADFSHVYREHIVKTNVLKHTKITEKEFNENERREWYMFADEAKEKGVFDEYIEDVDYIF